MNPLFKQSQARNSNCFISFILEQLHKELKKSFCYQNNNQNQPLNQYSRQIVQNQFLNDFKKEGSIISDHFFGFTETTNECLNCKQKYLYNRLPVPICYIIKKQSFLREIIGIIVIYACKKVIPILFLKYLLVQIF